MYFAASVIGVFAGSIWDIALNQGQLCVTFSRLFYRGLHLVGISF
jgi:hypothetical protein